MYKFVEEGPPQTEEASGRSSVFSFKRIVIVLALLIALAAVVGVTVYITTREKSNGSVNLISTTQPTTTLTSSSSSPSSEKLSRRIDCFPEAKGKVETLTKEKCEERKCTYDPQPDDVVPDCYFSEHVGYMVVGQENTAFGVRVDLELRGNGPFGRDIKKIVMEVEMRHNDILHFKFDDPVFKRFKVPNSLDLPKIKAINPVYELRITRNDSLAFQIIRKSNGRVLWDTSVGGFVFSDQFLQISTILPSKNIYGFGENLHKSFRHDLNYRTWPMWSRDQAPTWTANSNLYGVHPFYTCLEDDGKSHGVLLWNSNAQDYSLTPLPMLTYRTIGGILDFYMFFGPEPETVIQQYTQLIGRPFMPPYWSLGFQLCRYGYNSLDNLKAAVRRTKQYNIPHDVQYADIDHMNESQDFTIDDIHFKGLNDYFQELRAGGMRTIIILDPCFITNVTDYEPYINLTQVEGAIKWPDDYAVSDKDKDHTGAVLGYVWPKGKVVFPDFFNPKTEELWKRLIVKHRQRLVFDALWIDMNEPANFGTNEDRPWNWPVDAKPYWSLKCPESLLDDPPYRTMAAYVHDDKASGKVARLSEKTLCGIHRQGEKGEYRHYDVHSLYGWRQTPSTLQGAQLATGERSMVLSRSTFPGSGKYAGHWLGDNDSKWPDLADSIIGMLEFNLFGIPYIGADICGFWGNTTAEMCKRWMQLGAFYTFSRNHNGIGNIDQDPGSFGPEVAEASREAIETRYWLLPYLYTLFYRAHVDGHTVVRPLFHEFSADNKTYGIDRQFLWGHALMIVPILQEQQRYLSFYLPEGYWYSWYTGERFVGPLHKNITVNDSSKTELFVRGGTCLPQQRPANNTHFSRQNPMKLLVALDNQGRASGELFWDDGQSIDTYESGTYYLATFQAEMDSLQLVLNHNKYKASQFFDAIEVFGVENNVQSVQLDDGTSLNFTFNPQTKVLKITNLSLHLDAAFRITWRTKTDEEISRIDCYPDRLGYVDNVTKEKCEARRCIYQETNNNAPACFFPKQDYGYRVAGGRVETALGFRLPLTRRGSSPFSKDIENIIFEVELRGDNALRFKFDVNNSSERYKVPMTLNLPSHRGIQPRYEVIITSNDTFSFQVRRRGSGAIIWDSSVGGLTFADQFLQIATKLPTFNVYGFGENVHKSFRHNMNHKIWPMFSRDQGVGVDDRNNHYGVHPYYMCMEEDGQAHGVLLLNSNAQDYTFSPLPMLTYRTIGGILDFYIFLGPEPENVVQQYTEAIGRPYMPPYWSLGFQLCRYGYNHIDNLKAAVNRTRVAEIPHDVQYADIDHMDERKDFTVDNKAFQGLNDYFKSLQEGGMHTIIILDPALISNETNYTPYEKMKAVNGSIMWPDNYPVPEGSKDPGGSLLGYVWPKGKTVFPDFFKNETQRVWKELIIEHHNHTLVFDGLWIDMNEPASFGTNEEKPFNWPEDDKPYWSLKCAGSGSNTYELPPYRTMASFAYDDQAKNSTAMLSDKTICMAARQGHNNEYMHYDVHSLYGWSQTLSTLEGLRAATGKRGIVISRSTFPGSGKYAGHWLGDNNSQWGQLHLSIIGMLEFNLFGIPYIGADICGFFEDTTPEMCKRWMQLGAFYTFSRNHNGAGFRDQDPAVLGEDVARASKEVMEIRYWLLPYLYTLFHFAHTQGNTVIRPLHHEFPRDKATYEIDTQFLWGPALLISPILQEGQTSLTYYLPRGRWYNFYTGVVEISEQGTFHKRAITSDTLIPLHVRGGYILPLQAPANNTVYSRRNPFKLLVALEDSENTGRGMVADGQLFWDDGDSIDTYEKGIYFLASFKFQSNQLKMTVEYNKMADQEFASLYINMVQIMGVTQNTKFIVVNGTLHTNFTYDTTTKVLLINDLKLLLSQEFTVELRTETDEEISRIDCYPDRLGYVDNVTKEKCEARRCIYNETNNNAPACFFPKQDYGYRVAGGRVKTDLGFRLPLTRRGSSPFSKDIENITFEVEMRGDNVLRFKFDVNNSSERYKVPMTLNLPSHIGLQPRYEVIITSNDTFSFQVRRPGSGAIIWDSSVGGLTFADQFLQIATKLPTFNVYGFGENVHKSFRHNMNHKIWPMFSRDQGVGVDDRNNHYGVHPYYMCMEEDGQAHGVLLLNSNAQDYTFSPLPMLTYRTIGGILDFYIFLGPEPENVVQQYTEAIGRPYMPPYWSLGFQLCRYGYNHIENLKAAVNRTRVAEIPHDVQYADIDHMDERKDFTVDNKAFQGLNDYFKSLQEGGMHTIIILDPALISNETNYTPYEKMKAVNGSIMWPDNYLVPEGSKDPGGSLLGYVWPKGKTVFPDFFKNETQRVWKELIIEHHNHTLVFDGLWIDMNEPASFGTNEEKPFNWPEDDKPYWSLKCAGSGSNTYELPPYRTMASFAYDDQAKNRTAMLSDKTICMAARQGHNNEYMHYDVHSLYGWSQTLSTLEGLRAATGKRGIVISRSTFPGSGKYAGHWLGDNNSQWGQLHLSIIGMLEFNLFGIPYIGADICGFFEDTTPEMCKRWMQLGAFYTFSRNHNGAGFRDQDPAVLGEDVARASKEVMEIRYWLLPYLYTLFHFAHTQGNTVIRPLHHEFPRDKATYEIDTQFLWGPALLISPILQEGQISLTYYLPRGRWYNFYTGVVEISQQGSFHKRAITSDTPIPLHVRGGYILPLQAPSNNTVYSRRNPFKLLVALEDSENTGRGMVADGQLFWDDGDSIDTYENGSYYFARFKFQSNQLKMTVEDNKMADQKFASLYFNMVQIMGVTQNTKFIYVNDTLHTNFTYDTTTKVLLINDLKLLLSQEFTVELSEFRHPDENETKRIDCFPDIDGRLNDEAEIECKRRHCIFSPVEDALNIPKCYMNMSAFSYTRTQGTSEKSILQNNTLHKRHPDVSLFGDSIQEIKLIIEGLSNYLVHFKITDAQKTRYEVPIPLQSHAEYTGPYLYEASERDDPESGFSFQIKRNRTKIVLWNTDVGGLTYADQFLQIATRLPSKNIYGFGENRHFGLRHDMQYRRWPMFSRDNFVNAGDYANLYGVHPFYMCIEEDGNAHGVLLLNSNAMEILLQPLPSLIYRTLGGVLDFYMFMGPTPEDVIQQYTKFIGYPYLPPYWSLGFQLCRYGYNNLVNLKEAVNRTVDAGIPLDVQYADIDHMHERKDFTIDEVNFGGLPEYVKQLKTEGIHFIIILDPAVDSEAANYSAYELGFQKDIFIKWPHGTSPDSKYANNTDIMLGYVWPNGKVAFPDFFHPDAPGYWSQLIVDHHKIIEFDGLWIDMNEPANFGTNENKPWNWPANKEPWSLKCPINNNTLDNPPYKPRGVFGMYLSDKTLCMVALQKNGTLRHYDVHSLYGWSQTEHTLRGLQTATGKRGMVISRSTFPSSGSHSGHWLGDNDSKWSNLHDSIIGIIEFNLFGIPYVGADICGFNGDTNEELCQRWMQLGAFYTFSRNHNAINQRVQDPASFGPAVAKSSRQVLETRYLLLPYLYTLFYHVHTQGGTVIRSMLHEFPKDQRTWDIDTQFLWGPCLLIAPVLEQGKITKDVYFPEGNWFDYYSGKEITSKRMMTVDAPRDFLPLYIRGGYILPTQDAANNTVHSLKNPLGLIIAANSVGNAEGDLYWDDGDSIGINGTQGYIFTKFNFSKNSLLASVMVSNYTDPYDLRFQTVWVYGVKNHPVNVTGSGNSQIAVKYYSDMKMLHLYNFSYPLNSSFSLSWF